ncbi:hypothetical protein MHU86_21501 [Fragilaria crotonensis]|nr:hypothetical protein MHU86_21501 [Fragilaria crotonensis]
MGVPLALLNRDDALPDNSSCMKVLANPNSRTNRGFSQFSRAITYAPSLSQVPVRTLPALACWKAFGANNFKESLLCAADHGLRGGISGGPLLLSCSSVQVGIAICGASLDSRYSSYSLDEYQGRRTDTNSNTPKGYTRVSHFVEWIDAQICQFSASKPSNCQTKALKAVGETAV